MSSETSLSIDTKRVLTLCHLERDTLKRKKIILPKAAENWTLGDVKVYMCHTHNIPIECQTIFQDRQQHGNELPETRDADKLYRFNYPVLLYIKKPRRLRKFDDVTREDYAKWTRQQKEDIAAGVKRKTTPAVIEGNPTAVDAPAASVPVKCMCCSENAAEIQCHTCPTIMFYCGSCYEVVHGGPDMQEHIIEVLRTQERQVQAVQAPDPPENPALAYGWLCTQCTQMNLPHVRLCDCRKGARPAGYTIPRGYKPTQEEKHLQARQLAEELQTHLLLARLGQEDSAE